MLLLTQTALSSWQRFICVQKKKKRKPVDDWEITCKWYIRLCFRKKTHLTENEWNIFFVKNSFQILTIFDIGVYRGVYVIYLCCFIGHNTKREFFALSRQNHNNFADTYHVYNSQSQIRFTLHMILAHVLVAIDYYAKCPNLKKPDSLSSTYICSNATHYFKILKKVFAKSLKNHFFFYSKKMHFFPTFEHCGRKDVNRLEFNMKPFIFCVFNGR